LIVLATIPAAIVGLTLKDWFARMFDSPLAAGCGFLVTAVLLMLGHVMDRGDRTEKQLAWPAVLLIGCFQALAPLPGVSRSGSTIAAGLLIGMNRVSATRFSFVLAVPVTAGAIALTIKDLLEGDPKHAMPPMGPMIVGIVVSFVVGWLVLNGMIRLVQQRRLPWFAAYCVCIGVVTIALSLSASPSAATSAAPVQASAVAVER
jgi:undecaprenyl-diphosphatase